tara:strand:- start:108 stop:521 length:414 start_codon:yes stop_codon:yes gene_type:complete
MKLKENKIARYDRTKNKVIVNVTQEGDIENSGNVIGTTYNTYKQEYEPEEMKKIYAGIQAQITQLQNQLKELTLRQDTTILKYSKEEIEELEAKMLEIKTLKQVEQDKVGRINMEEGIKALKKDAEQLKPIIQKLRK